MLLALFDLGYAATFVAEAFWERRVQAINEDSAGEVDRASEIRAATTRGLEPYVRQTADPLRPYELRPGARFSLGGLTYHINALGLRGEEIAAKPDGVYRIGLFGGDPVFGVGLAEEETYAARLQAKLRSAGKNVEVLNIGALGSNLAYDLKQYDLFALRLELDEAVFFEDEFAFDVTRWIWYSYDQITDAMFSPEFLRRHGLSDDEVLSRARAAMKHAPWLVKSYFNGVMYTPEAFYHSWFICPSFGPRSVLPRLQRFVIQCAIPLVFVLDVCYPQPYNSRTRILREAILSLQKKKRSVRLLDVSGDTAKRLRSNPRLRPWDLFVNGRAGKRFRVPVRSKRAAIVAKLAGLICRER